MRPRSRSTNGRAARSSSIRAQIRNALGFREGSVADAEALAEWLVTSVTQSERSGERVREQLMARCRDERKTPAALVDLISELVNVGSDLGGQRRREHLPSTIADDLVEQRP